MAAKNSFIKTFDKIFNNLPNTGILLVTRNEVDFDNIATISWITFGYVWNDPVVNIYVRPGRFSHHSLMENGFFSINVLDPNKYESVMSYCGTISGNDGIDKFKHEKLKKIESEYINCPHIDEAKVVLECQVIHRNVISAESLDRNYTRFYDNDFHSIFTGLIVNIKNR